MAFLVCLYCSLFHSGAANWDPDHGNGSVPEVKGAKWFSFEELKRFTQGFSESNCIGLGGYGKVCRYLYSS